MKIITDNPNNGQVNFDDMIIDLIKNFLATRDIANLIEQMYGQKYIATSISNLTDIALKEIEQ